MRVIIQTSGIFTLLNRIMDMITRAFLVTLRERVIWLTQGRHTPFAREFMKAAAAAAAVALALALAMAHRQQSKSIHYVFIQSIRK